MGQIDVLIVDRQSLFRAGVCQALLSQAGFEPFDSPPSDDVLELIEAKAPNVVLLDIDYSEDVTAQVDMNVVMTGSGKFIEIQGTGEEHTFSNEQLTGMLDLAGRGITELTRLQKEALDSIETASAC